MEMILEYYTNSNVEMDEDLNAEKMLTNGSFKPRPMCWDLCPTWGGRRTNAWSTRLRGQHQIDNPLPPAASPVALSLLEYQSETHIPSRGMLRAMEALECLLRT